MSELPSGLDPDILERVVTISVDLENEDKMQHRADVNGFTFHSDEGAFLGGDDEHTFGAGSGSCVTRFRLVGDS